MFLANFLFHHKRVEILFCDGMCGCEYNLNPILCYPKIEDDKSMRLCRFIPQLIILNESKSRRDS